MCSLESKIAWQMRRGLEAHKATHNIMQQTTLHQPSFKTSKLWPVSNLKAPAGLEGGGQTQWEGEKVCVLNMEGNKGA